MGLKKSYLLIAAIMLLTSVTAQTSHAESKLSAGQIKALFPGQFTGTIKEKYDFNLTGLTNGRLIGSGWGITGEGRWSIENNKFCMHFWILKKGKKCRTLYRTSKNSYVGRRDDGKSWITFKRMPLPRKVQDTTPQPFQASN